MYLIYIRILDLMMRHRIPCIFNELTGFYCPGCGGTRSLIALLSGHPVKSFILHPFLIVFIVQMAIVFIRRIRRGMFTMSKPEIAVMLTVLLGQWMVKNVLLLFGVDIISIAMTEPLYQI